MDVTLHHAFLPHTDAEAALGFYRDLLGLELRNDVGYDGMRWLTLGPAGGTGTTLVLHPPAVDPGLSDDERRTVLELIAKGSYGAALTLATDDLDGLFKRLVDGGADVLQEPMDQPYGVRDCAFRDPTGNLLRINEVR
ncbi:VOC family protein [Nocardioides sp. Arc9.136]|uniref:VOC family protein n=1 Tax=Nocardioides sp. Arc9.136 TaxID=2996826 RepID=UPI002666C630|nr:VOC family protein [Nocardioides sp. Arc9.136]WKN49737.1 VOC family protein [Nocardioides sp. Arc9.136]